MRIGKLLLVVAGSIVGVSALAFAVLFAVTYTEDMVAEYENHAEAVADGSVARGWVPEFVPETARSIRDVHNIDTNRQWMRFEVPEEDARRMISEMAHVSPQNVSLPRRPPRWSGRWVPRSDIESGGTTLTYHRESPEVYRARCVAVEWSSDTATAFVWTC